MLGCEKILICYCSVDATKPHLIRIQPIRIGSGFILPCRQALSVSKSKLVEWTEYLIDNVYIKVGNNLYRQTIGIPMGTDCAPQLANLFLFHYEYLYMKNLMRDNLCMVKRFSNTVRYIDDLLTLNNSHFEEEITNIYPSELTLKGTSESDTKLSYLDISISICSSNMLLRSMTKEMPLILT